MEKLDQFLSEQHQLKAVTKSQYRYAFACLSRFTDNPYGLSRMEMNVCLGKMADCLSPCAWNGYVSCIKRFYRWRNKLENNIDEFPDCVKDVKLKRIRRLDYVAKKIRTEEEVKALIRGSDNPRDRAMISTAFAIGCRRGELLNIHLRDIEIQPYGYRILLCGKTGTHKSPPIDREFAKILSVWLEHHPQRDNPDSPLWVRRKGNRFEGIRTTMVHNVLKNAVRNAGLKRNFTWHMARHTENTWATARGVSRASRNLTHGWSPNSNTAAIYESLTDQDAEREYRRVHGAKAEEVQVKDGFATVKCAYCGEDNPGSAKFCLFCHVPLSVDEARKFMEDRENLDLLKTPGFLEWLWQKFLKEKKA